MPLQRYSIEIDGYWREQNKKEVPNKSGVYCVYTCSYNKSSDKVSINKLIYIGESKEVCDRILNHEKQDEWESCLAAGESLCYSFGRVSSAYRKRCEEPDF